MSVPAAIPDIHVRLDPATFRRYCFFDAFRRRRLWFWPVLAAMILITFSLAGILGWLKMSSVAAGLLMGLGLAVPMAAFGLFFIQIEVQISRRNLSSSPVVYVIRLDDEGIKVFDAKKKNPPANLPWDTVPAAFRRRGDIYLYANRERALILPHGQAKVPSDEIWAFLEHRLGPGKTFDL